METELQNILQRAKLLQHQILHTSAGNDPLQSLRDIKQHYDKLADITAQTHYLNEQLKLIRNSLRGYITTNIKNIQHDIDIIEDPMSTMSDIQRVGTHDDNMHEIAPGIHLPVITVKYEDLIPSSPLYYVSSTGMYAVKILDSVMSGHVGHIDNSKKVYACTLKYDHNTGTCRYRHAGEPPTWSQSSWMYTPHSLNASNRLMRHMGDRDTLLLDIKQSVRAERATRSEQTMHDVLVKLCMDTVVGDRVKCIPQISYSNAIVQQKN